MDHSGKKMEASMRLHTFSNVYSTFAFRSFLREWYTEQYFSWEEDKKEEFIVDALMPWYVNFFAGWIKHKDDENTKFIWYEELMPNKLETVSSILKAAGHPEITEDDITVALNTKPKLNPRMASGRFNKGIAGRGNALSEKASAKLSTLLSYYANEFELPQFLL